MGAERVRVSACPCVRDYLSWSDSGLECLRSCRSHPAAAAAGGRVWSGQSPAPPRRPRNPQQRTDVCTNRPRHTAAHSHRPTFGASPEYRAVLDEFGLIEVVIVRWERGREGQREREGE